MLPSIEGFWSFVQERELIRIRKESGNPPPWTNDLILQDYHFCNIRRADDFGTRWYVNLMSPKPRWGFREVLWRTMLYRLVNNIKWFNEVSLFGYGGWGRNRDKWVQRIMDAPKPHSPAYIVLQTLHVTDRKTQLIKVLDELYDWFRYGNGDKQIQNCSALEEVWKTLQQPHGIGPFIALQVFRDLLLIGALPFKENDFTYLGPGAQLGIHMLNSLDDWGKTAPSSYASMYRFCEALHANQPERIQPLVLGDIEHCCCEYAKYIKFSRGEGRRRRYKPHVQNLA
jgi:hypothetical protein